MMVMALVTALSCVTSVLNNIANEYCLDRDYAVSFLLMAIPVAYPLDALPRDWQWAFLLNPLTPAFRGLALGSAWHPSAALVVDRDRSFAHTMLLAGGLIFFLRWEQTILDRS
jgi:ABC-type polysaccharide/polyol phosphate export permease